MITLTERQLHATLLPVVRYKQAMVIRGANFQRLRAICHGYDVEVVEPFPLLRSHDQEVTLVRLLRPGQRDRAMVVPYWPEIPKPLLVRVTQYRLETK
jgi:hypothetical protein